MKSMIFRSSKMIDMEYVGILLDVCGIIAGLIASMVTLYIYFDNNEKK